MPNESLVRIVLICSIGTRLLDNLLDNHRGVDGRKLRFLRGHVKSKLSCMKYRTPSFIEPPNPWISELTPHPSITHGERRKSISMGDDPDEVREAAAATSNEGLSPIGPFAAANHSSSPLEQLLSVYLTRSIDLRFYRIDRFAV